MKVTSKNLFWFFEAAPTEYLRGKRPKFRNVFPTKGIELVGKGRLNEELESFYKRQNFFSY